MGCSLRGVIVWCPDAFPVLSSTLWEEFVGCCDAIVAHFFFAFLRRDGLWTNKDSIILRSFYSIITLASSRG
jgi:hypothetical protein